MNTGYGGNIYTTEVGKPELYLPIDPVSQHITALHMRAGSSFFYLSREGRWPHGRRSINDY